MDQSTGLRTARKASGKSLRAVARAADVDPAYLSRAEHGLATPPIATFARIMAAVGAEDVAATLLASETFVRQMLVPVEVES